MKKRMMAWLLAAALLTVWLTGCAKAPAKQTNETTASEQQTAPEASSDDEIVITIWEAQWGNDNYEDVLKKLAQQATDAHIDGKNIRVEVACIPWSNYYETFMTAYQTGTGPDIACQASTAPSQYDELGATLDLSPIIEAWKTENPDFYNEIGEDAIAFEQNADGKQIAIPFAVDGKNLQYNKEVFEAAGITELPTNYDELTACFEKIKAIGVIPFACRADHCSLNNYLVFSNGGYNIGLDYSIHLDDERATHMLDIFQSWWDNGYIAEGCAGYSDDDAQKMLLNGDLAVTLAKSPAWCPVDQRDKIGTLPVMIGPDATEETHHNSMSYQAYYAYNTTEHPEETLAVLKWWIENGDILYTEGGNSCVPLRATQFKAITGDDPALNAFYNKTVDNDGVRASFIYPFEHFETWYGIFDGNKVNTKAIMCILTGEDYHDGLADSIAETKEILESYGVGG